MFDLYYGEKNRNNFIMIKKGWHDLDFKYVFTQKSSHKSNGFFHGVSNEITTTADYVWCSRKNFHYHISVWWIGTNTIFYIL